MLQYRRLLLTTIFILACSWAVLGQKRYKALIIDGQNNHKDWKQTSQLMKTYLEETGLFSVDILTNYPSEGGALDSFTPDFSKYNVVVSNYNGYQWPQKINQAFQQFVNGGGGLVVVHAANNAFPGWKEYNKMIGVGGWGGRNEKSGPALRYNDEKGQPVYDNSPGLAGGNSAEHTFKVKIRSKTHPITQGLQPVWLHEQDEIFHNLRGPAENMEVLATAFSAKEQKGTGRHEPVVMVIRYGSGRVFHTTLGHSSNSQKGVGFITLLQRGTEWAASGNVTQRVPADFPKEDKASKRP
jgi:type 1 glutamine amidotransferase